MGVKLQSALGGSVELNAPSTASNFTMTVPAGNGTVATTDQLAGFRNRIINGDMRIDQRNNGASVTANDGTYIVDRFRTETSQSSRLTAQRNQGSLTPPAGFTNYLGITSSSAYSIGADDRFNLAHWIEGLNSSDLDFGKSSAKTITVSYWVRSSLTGTFGATIIGYDQASSFRSYPYTYTISAANTWEYKTITIPGDTTTFAYGVSNNFGLFHGFSLGNGSNFSGTANTWQAGIKYAPTGATSLVGTNGATWQVTGLQLEPGSVATPFERRPFQTELALCQRYCVLHGTLVGGYTLTLARGQTSGNNIWRAALDNPVPMRVTPSLTAVNVEGWNSAVGSLGFSGVSTIYSLNGIDVEFDCVLTSSFPTGGLPGFIQTKGTGGASYILANAEL
jgi:hypothetical protein